MANSGNTPIIIDEYLHAHGYSKSRLSQDLGFWDGWLQSLIDSDKTHIQPYMNLAAAGNKSLQELVNLIEGRTISTYIDELLQKYKSEGVEHRTALAEHIKVSESLLRTLYKNDGKLKGLNSYVVLAKKLGRDIDDLFKSPSHFQH